MNGCSSIARSTTTFRISDDKKELVLKYAKAQYLILTELYRNVELDKIAVYK